MMAYASNDHRALCVRLGQAIDSATDAQHRLRCGETGRDVRVLLRNAIRAQLAVLEALEATK